MNRKRLHRHLRRVKTSWNRFWFRSDGTSQTAMFRAVFGALMVVFYSIRALDLTFFFASDGFVPDGVLHDIIPRPGAFSIFNHFSSHTALWLGQAAFLVSLAFLSLGKLPRLSALTALVIHLSFLHRNILIAYGVDFITTFYLLYMIFADHRVERVRKTWDLQAMLGSVAYRLCQLQVCVIYGYSGLQKLRGVRWWQGEAIWDVIANTQLTRYDLTWLAHFPIVILLANYSTLIWEIYFPAIIWNKKLRYPTLIFGILLHIGIAFVISITFFSALMIATYIFFMESAHCNALRHHLGARVAILFRKIKDSPRAADQSLV